MKRLQAILFFLGIATLTAFGQGLKIKDPTTWKLEACKVDEGIYDLAFTVTIEDGWSLYSQNIEDGGPIPTSFMFGESADYILLGKTREFGKVKEEMDPYFEMVVRKYNKQVVFKQQIQGVEKTAFDIQVSYEYMSCSDKECTPPLFKEKIFRITGTEPACESKDNTANASANTSDKTPETGETHDDTAVSAMPPADTPSTATQDTAETAGETTSSFDDECGGMTGGKHSRSLWGIFIAGVLGGLLALFTPCVFPIIPLTVSFFTKQSKDRRKGMMNAIIYAISIMVIYVGLGFIITKVLGPDALNAMASNVWFNMAFFFIFVIFAISFFGAFEITLPSSWVNKTDRFSDKGGLIGIFFMAFTLSLVSFSCTGPIIGTLLVEAAVQGNNLGPIVGMTGFSLALAVPFALFAAFPAWLQSLPRSGGWLNTVKISLGFLELALALKFLSNVDLAYHWGILKRETFISLWIIIFGLLGLYLLGFVRLSHDSEQKPITIPRLLLAIITLSFTVYLIPGLWGHPLKMISGFPPPEFYKEWVTESSHCPHGLNCFHDYDDAIAFAEQEGKPLLVDFTGWSCVNCRRMEDNVWADPKVLKTIAEDYVLVSLYVDDREMLPEAEQYYSEETDRKIRTVGDKWSELEVTRFQNSAQPWYALIDHRGNPLADPRGYTPNVDKYYRFLQEGLCRYRKRFK